jgi:hypothetical protein
MLPILFREHDDPDQENGLRNERQQGSYTTPREEQAVVAPRRFAYRDKEGDERFSPIPTDCTACLILFKEITQQ